MSRRVGISAVLVALVALTSCGGHGAGRTRSAAAPATGSATASSSSPGSGGGWSTANVYDRVLHAESSYTGLRGSMTLQESTAAGSFQLGGSFATDLQDFGGPSSEVELQSTATPPKQVAVRAIGSSVYYRLAAGHWENVSLINPVSYTALTADRRNLAAQLLSGLDSTEYTALLSAAKGLKQLPASPGRAVFTGTVELGAVNTTALRYSPGLIVGYEGQGITTETITVGFDDQARPTTLRERLSSAKLTVDYQLTITGYTAPKVTAPS